MCVRILAQKPLSKGAAGSGDRLVGKTRTWTEQLLFCSNLFRNYQCSKRESGKHGDEEGGELRGGRWKSEGEGREG
jgi:hypothetical protein